MTGQQENQQQQQQQEKDRPDEELYSFFNAFIATTDAPEFYMQQFWHTVAYNLEAKTYFFTLDDQSFEVNAKLLRQALQITLKVFDHPFIQPPLENKIISFIKKLGYLYNLEQVSKMEDFKFQIDYGKISSKKKELLPFLRFINLIIKYILSKNNNVSRRLHSYQHVIKLDATLGNLKFTNKGSKDPIYGMVIPLEMMSDEIKVSVDYLDFLEKLKGNKPAKGRGKGLLTKKCVKVVMEKIQTDSDEEDLYHSKKLKGIETLSDVAQFMINMKKTRKASKHDFIFKQRSKGSGKGSDVIPEFINDNPDVSLTDVLKDPVKIEINQWWRLIKLEKKVDIISTIDHSEAINKSVQAHLKKVLPKATPGI
nr:hypothetical protein [Tanacetum cinerariifolium]